MLNYGPDGAILFFWQPLLFWKPEISAMCPHGTFSAGERRQNTSINIVWLSK